METHTTCTPCKERKASVVRAACGMSRLKLSSHSLTEHHKGRAEKSLKVRAASVSGTQETTIKVIVTHRPLPTFRLLESWTWIGPAATPLYYDLFKEVKLLKGLLVPKDLDLLEY